MALNPYKPENSKRAKRSLILLPHRKYYKSKGTMRRVKFEPQPAVPCIVLRYDGELFSIPTEYADDKKTLVSATSGNEHVFVSRSRAKRAIYHTVQRDGGEYSDFEIVDK